MTANEFPEIRPTLAEFDSFGGDYEAQGLSTGWIGYGENALFVWEYDNAAIVNIARFISNRVVGRQNQFAGDSFEDYIFNDVSKIEGVTNLRRHVKCRSGIADIVADGLIIECKVNPKRTELFQAVGQVLLYRADIEPNARVYVFACMPKHRWKAVQGIVETAAAIGVGIHYFPMVGDEQS